MEEIKQRIGVAIREIRLERDLSQADLARLCGLPQQTISAAELGKTIPRADTLLTLAHALGVSPDRIYQKAGLMPDENEQGRDGQAPFWELWTIYSRLDEKERATLIDYARYQDRKK